MTLKTASVTKMTYDEWEEKYKPIQNHIDPHQGFRFETFGEELEFIKQQPVDRVWTITEADDDLIITNGFSFVNRLNYIVTEVPCQADFIEVLYD
jgi:hypothetical protein